MNKKRNIAPKRSLHSVLVMMALVLSVFSFSVQTYSPQLKHSQPVRTELVFSKERPVKKTTVFAVASVRAIAQPRRQYQQISEYHTQRCAKQISRPVVVNPISAPPKIISSLSDEDPSLHS